MIKADVFFFVTTIAVVILTVVITIAILYAVKILSIFRQIGDTLKRETDYMAQEMSAFREKMRERRSGIVAFATLLRHLFRHYRY